MTTRILGIVVVLACSVTATAEASVLTRRPRHRQDPLGRRVGAAEGARGHQDHSSGRADGSRLPLHGPAGLVTIAKPNERPKYIKQDRKVFE
jgi:hypothetical protein